MSCALHTCGVLAAALAMCAAACAGEPARKDATAAPAAGQAGIRRITATLFYVSEDGAHLAGAQREVAFSEGTPGQARAIVEALLEAPPAPHGSAIPAGTALRALYMTDRGEVFVDLSSQVTAGHDGGVLDELLTVYAIVNSLTVNLPAITAVQILVDGKEVDTLAGHVDLRRPLPKNLEWTENPE